jgi:protein-L-isoaspartate(D-aspartate) O-methyltransferase
VLPTAHCRLPLWEILATVDERNESMIRSQIVPRGVNDPRVIQAFRSVPRALFVPPSLQDEAYDDSPLPIGHHQTISQPFIVALMTSLLELKGTERVLEVGTGSGYQTAILGRLAREVCSAEIVPGLSARVGGVLEALGIRNVVLREGNAVEVFRERTPFDAILAGAAPETMPDELLDQLAEGGRAVLPVGGEEQFLWVIERRNGKLMRSRREAVRFVPMK